MEGLVTSHRKSLTSQKLGLCHVLSEITKTSAEHGLCQALVQSYDDAMAAQCTPCDAAYTAQTARQQKTHGECWTHAPGHSLLCSTKSMFHNAMQGSEFYS